MKLRASVSIDNGGRYISCSSESPYSEGLVLYIYKMFEYPFQVEPPSFEFNTCCWTMVRVCQVERFPEKDWMVSLTTTP